jgi:hypothetical protein
MKQSYTQEITAEYLLAIIDKQKAIKSPGMDYFARSSNREPQQLSTDSSAITSNRSREQLNNAIIKELNNTSRNTSEDEIEAKSPLSQKQDAVVLTGPRLLTYRGISVQHCRPKEGVPKQGIKLAISLQTLEDAQLGERLLVTAELKRYDRLREIKPRLDDSADFAVLLEDMKQSIYADKDRSVCLGRIHARGKRSAWYNDCLIIATIKNDIIQNVILSLFGEEYVVPMTQELTPYQQPIYLSAGSYGELVNNNGGADLRKAKRTPFAK